MGGLPRSRGELAGIRLFRLAARRVHALTVPASSAPMAGNGSG
jgi:hypothetical protein